MKMKLLAVAIGIAVAAPVALAPVQNADALLLKDLGRQIKKGAKKLGKSVSNAFKNIGRTIKNGVAAGVKTLKKMGKSAAKKALRPVFHAYILANRKSYKSKAKALRSSEKTYLRKFFPKGLVDSIRVLELKNSTGYFNKSAGATTYGRDLVIIKRGHRSNSLLKHELVHGCQYLKYGVKGFAYKYADQYVDGGYSYRNIKFEKDAYGFQKSGKGSVSSALGSRYCRR